MSPRSVCCGRLSALLLPLLLAIPASAQDAGRVEARVTYIAGDNAYLDAGAEAGLAPGDTVVAFRNDRRLGPLRVVSATADRAVVAFVAAPFPVTLGDVLVLESLSPPEPEPSPTPTSPAGTLVADRPSILARPAETRRSGSSLRMPTLSGRFQTGVSVLSSRTRPTAGAVADTRTFSLPFAALRASAEGLPGGLRLDANLRATYRSSEGFTFDQPADVRVYQLSAQKAFTALPLQVRAGRFYNPYDRFSGYWDGLTLHVGNDDRGVGVAAGFQPSRADEAPSGDLPKYTVFGHAAAEVGGARVEGTVLGGQALPQAEGLTARTFVGVEQTARARGFSLSTQALADQEPGTGSWTLTRLSGRLSVAATPGVRLSAFALSRRPYLLADDIQTILNRSTRVGGGVSFRILRSPLPNTSLHLDAAHATAEGRPSTESFSGGLSIPRLPVGGLGLTAHATVWMQDAADGTTRRGVYGGAGLTRAFGSVYGRIGYRYQQSPLGPDDTLVTHGVDAMLQIPVGRRLAFTIQADTQLGDRISNTRVYTALWCRL